VWWRAPEEGAIGTPGLRFGTRLIESFFSLKASQPCENKQDACLVVGEAADHWRVVTGRLE
jgi:hypothetical protein